MSQKNRISLNIPESDLAEIRSCIDTLQEKLLPHLAFLSPEDGRQDYRFRPKIFGILPEQPRPGPTVHRPRGTRG